MKEEKDIHPIDDLFRQSLEGYTPPPPKDAWKNIRIQLLKGRGFLWNFLVSLPGLFILSTVLLSISALLVYNTWDPSHKKEINSVNVSPVHQVISNTLSHKPTPTKKHQNTTETTVNNANNTIQNKPTATEGSLAESNPTFHPSESRPSLAAQKHDAPYASIERNQPGKKELLQTPAYKAEITKKKTKPTENKSISKAKNSAVNNTLPLTVSYQDKSASSTGNSLPVIQGDAAVIKKEQQGEKTIITGREKPADMPGNKSITENKNQGEESTNPETAKSMPGALPSDNIEAIDAASKKDSAGTQPIPAKPGKPGFPDMGILKLNAGFVGGAGQTVMLNYSPLPFYSFYATVGVNHMVLGSGLETGIGFSRQIDRGKYEFEFLKTDTTGYTGFTYFNKIDSSYLIIYMPVIDKEQILLAPTTRTTYSYLCIPVYYSQKVFKSGKFSLSLKTGPSMNILIRKQDIQPSIQYPGADFIRLTNQSYTRLSTYWQLLIATRFSWQLTNQLSFLLEPSVQFYLNNLYESYGKPSSKPYGIGIWTGFQYQFKK